MPEAADKALPLLEQAIAIEPDYAAAHAAIAFCHEVRFIRGGLLENDKRAGLQHARIAIGTGGDDATALAVAAFVIGILERDYDNAFDAFDRALALSPSSALALSFSAIVHPWAGEYAISVEQAEQSLRLSPSGSLRYMPYVGLAYAHFFAGRFEEAALAASRAAQANPQFSIPWVLRTASLASLGRSEEARASAQRLGELWPGFTIREDLASNFTSPDRLDMLGEALRRAGLPE